MDSLGFGVWDLRQYSLDHFAVNIGETEVATLEPVGQLFMIDAEAMEDRGVKVMNVHGIHRHVVAKLVGFAVTEAGLHAASGHPDRITPAVMVAAVVVLFNFALAIGGPSEFTAPNDQRVVQQSALL